MPVKTKYILTSLIGLVLILIGLITYFGITRYQSMVVKPNISLIKGATPTPTPDPDKPFSVLMLGYGGGVHEGGELTDSIMQVIIKPKEKKIDLVSIPRDLWVELPVGTSQPFFSKINAAYAIGDDPNKYPNRPAIYTGAAGGGEMAKQVISNVTGVKPDYFVAVDFSGFTKAIDLLGGVDVNVEKTFTDNKYPIEEKKDDTCGKSPEEVTALTATMSGDKLEDQFPCRYEILSFKKGLTHMDGTTALKYARSRHSLQDGGDFNRAARQRQIVLAVKQKVVSLDIFSKAIPLLNTLAAHVKTDIDIPQLEKFLARGMEFSGYTITSVPLADNNVLVNGWSADHQAILMPQAGIGQFDAVKAFVASEGASKK